MKKQKGLLIVISGPSGAGKGTICKKLLKKNKNLYLSISMTSRSPRGKEINGKDYYFVSKEEFEDRIKNNKFLEHAIVHDEKYYGTPKDKVEEMLDKGKDVILEIDIQGALKVKEKYPEGIFIFLMPPSMRELRNRLVKRHTETKDKIIERFTKAYQEMNERTKYHYVVINDKVNYAINKILAIIESEKCRVDRIEDVDLNNREELIHELIINKKIK